MSEYISREAAKDNVSQFLSTHAFVVLPELRKSFDKIPSADVRENIHGEWILTYRDCGVEYYLCSKCNSGRAVIDGDFYRSLDEFKKCPICGADMRGEQNG